MVTGHRLVHDLLVAVFDRGFVVQIVAVIAIDSHPVHFTPAPHIGFADNRNVVFRLAGNHATVAADALVQVNRHAPHVGGGRIFVSVHLT